MASFTSPTIHATADTLAVQDYNAVAENTVWLAQAPYFDYFDSAGTSLTNGVGTALLLGGTTAVGYGFSLSSNNVVVPQAGTYMLSFSVGVTNAGTSGILIASVNQNGAAIAQGSQTLCNSTYGTVSSGSAFAKCNAGDTLTLIGFQTSGGSLASVNNAAVTFIAGVFTGLQ